jgi:excisionase family DNA binding protein
MVNARNRTFLTGGRMTEPRDLDAPDALLTPAEVAALFRVNPKTVTRWARAGKLPAIRTLGGHRRFRVSDVRRVLDEMSADEMAPPPLDR